MNDTDNVIAFLSHPDTTQQLSQSLSPFSRPSPKSKSEFESKTAAIHVESNSKSSFNLNEIKADAQWLSQTANIDEITALRITIIEWQDRPAARLTANFSNEEATSIQSAAGVDSLRVSVAGPNLASILRQAGGDENASSFDTEKSRRLRLRNIYISERAHILKTLRKLLVLSLHDFANDLANPDEALIARKITLSKLGLSLFKEKKSGDGLKQSFDECITGIRKRLKDIAADGGWLGASESNEETEATWKTTLVEEIVHILQLMFHQLRASSEVPSGVLLESWLGLMDEYDFLEALCVVRVGMIRTFVASHAVYAD
ncbi:hypothetical protein VI817_005631 [Penicillium citrinum]|nr:hypothetical protein VI817_005631 [Penicillium citrinum]